MPEFDCEVVVGGKTVSMITVLAHNADDAQMKAIKLIKINTKPHGK